MQVKSGVRAFDGMLPHTPTHRVAKFKMRDDPSLKARAVDLEAIVK